MADLIKFYRPRLAGEYQKRAFKFEGDLDFATEFDRAWRKFLTMLEIEFGSSVVSFAKSRVGL